MKTRSFLPVLLLSLSMLPSLAVAQSVDIRSDANTVGTAFFEGWNFTLTDDCPKQNTCKFKALRLSQGGPLQEAEGFYGDWPPTKGKPPSILAMTMKKTVFIIPISKIEMPRGKKWKLPPPNEQ